MKEILEKVDFEAYTAYKININIVDSHLFPDIKEGDPLVDQDGQSRDPISDVRRSIKYSSPFENKKIIESMEIEDEREDMHGNFCRNIDVNFYLLIDKEDEEFSTEVLHDELEEEWRDGSECKITITPYEN